MQKTLISFKLFFLCTFCLASTSHAEEMIFYPAPITPPAFSWKDAKGSDVTLENFKGKVILLNFWATYCTFCRIEMPAFDKMLSQYPADDFTIIPISLADPLDKIEDFYKQVKLKKLGIFYEDEGQIKSTFGVNILPSTFLINRKGKLVAYKEGAANWLGEEVANAIQTEIAKK